MVFADVSGQAVNRRAPRMSGLWAASERMQAGQIERLMAGAKMRPLRLLGSAVLATRDIVEHADEEWWRQASARQGGLGSAVFVPTQFQETFLQLRPQQASFFKFMRRFAASRHGMFCDLRHLLDWAFTRR